VSHHTWQNSSLWSIFANTERRTYIKSLKKKKKKKAKPGAGFSHL
jgi:hypothetical protein